MLRHGIPPYHAAPLLHSHLSRLPADGCSFVCRLYVFDLVTFQSFSGFILSYCYAFELICGPFRLNDRIRICTPPKITFLDISNCISVPPMYHSSPENVCSCTLITASICHTSMDCNYPCLNPTTTSICPYPSDPGKASKLGSLSGKSLRVYIWSNEGENGRTRVYMMRLMTLRGVSVRLGLFYSPQHCSGIIPFSTARAEKLKDTVRVEREVETPGTILKRSDAQRSEVKKGDGTFVTCHPRAYLYKYASADSTWVCCVCVMPSVERGRRSRVGVELSALTPEALRTVCCACPGRGER